jgi:hypothetical protein
MEQGYYEGLTNVNRFNSQLWEIYMNRPTGWLNIKASGLTRPRDDFLQGDLARGVRSEVGHGVYQTNRWGMRDQDYSAMPADGVVRGVLLGFSTVFGWGVGQDETFETVLERRINERLTELSAGKFELLNVAVPGYRPPQQAMALDESLKFAPHLVFYTAAGREQWRSISFLADILEEGVEIPYPELSALIRGAGVKPGMDHSTILKLLKLHEDSLLGWVYSYIAERCAEKGIQAVWIYLPELHPARGDAEEHERARELAAAAGFEIIDLTGIFEGQDVDALSLADWDKHPSAEVHELIADRLYSAIKSRPQVFKLLPL